MAKKVLFVDTDLVTTKSYAIQLFDRELKVPYWVEDANEMDLYIFLEPNAPWIDDGTRMPEKDRNVLSEIHRKGFKDAGIKIQSFSWYGDSEGAYEGRLKEVIKYVDKFLSKF